MKDLNEFLEHFIAPIVERSVTKALKEERRHVKQSKAPKRIGGIELAIEVTGLAKQTIYAKCSKNEIPYFKRGGKLYFNREKLTMWLEEGNETVNS